TFGRVSCSSAYTGRDLRGGRFGEVEGERHVLEPLDHAVLVAAYVERAAQALRPDARVQVAGLVDELEPAALEEAYLVGPREQHRDADPASLDLGGGHQRPADPGGPDLGRDG